MEEEIRRQYEEQVNKEKAALEKRVQETIEEQYKPQLESLSQQLTAKTELLKTAQDNELKLRLEKQQLDERVQAFDLEVQRKVDEAKNVIEGKVRQQLQEDYTFKLGEREQKIRQLTTEIEELRQKALQGSQQTQGETFEIQLKDALMTAFPSDSIESIKKGKKGADVIQHVNNPTGECCGLILWEAKRTKHWDNNWIEKLKDDQREIGADLGVIASSVLPKDLTNFDYEDGVWITDFQSAIGLAKSLRLNLMQVTMIKNSQKCKDEKMEYLYNYLIGPEFSQRVRAVFNLFTKMQSEVDKERRTMESLWATREKQIDSVLDNVVRIYGDLRGMVEMPEIPELSLEALPYIEDTKR